ncbi:patatin-like phospholipase family protein [Dyella japonica]|uniref:PNPLA domain-containing protein n=1 Tax=Dyella japonica TaxID=231455 RepID=A0ABV2K003_9GAMM
MSAVAGMAYYKFDQVETLVFAGGGNRCWWQAGLLTQLFDSGFGRPQRFVGTSGGAAVAASLLTYGAQHALDTCITAYASNPSIFDFSRRPKLRFAHTTIYPAWIATFLNAESFSKFRASTTTLTVAVTRPNKLLGVSGSALAGTLAYLVEKYWSKSLHPKLPRWLGLRQDFLTICADTSMDAAQTLLVASATAPPIMPALRVNGDFALDGGFVDSVPVEEQTLEQRRRTLVLLTRHYPDLPMLFTLGDRTYLQPSAKVPVSTWDCTAKTDVTCAFEMGRRDALCSMQSGLLIQSA